jgi:hypothetical protein
MSSLSRLFVHAAGMIAVSHVILSDKYHFDFYQNLNATDIFQNVFQPIGGDSDVLGTLLQVLVYSVVAWYMFHWARLEIDHKKIVTSLCIFKLMIAFILLFQ